jgi:hypothetical protein
MGSLELILVRALEHVTQMAGVSGLIPAVTARQATGSMEIGRSGTVTGAKRT